MKSPFFQLCLGILISLFVFLGSLSGAIEKTSVNKDYYIKKFEENNIPQVTGKSMEDLMVIRDDLIEYLQTGKNTLLEKHFNEREILHMEDVYHLMVLNQRIFYTSIFLWFLGSYVYYRIKGSWKILLASNIILLFFIALLIGLIALNFSKSFILFHEIFFQNDLWILNPKTDLMIQMLPENFFKGMANNILYLLLGSQSIYMILLILGKRGYFGKNSLYRRLF